MAGFHHGFVRVGGVSYSRGAAGMNSKAPMDRLHRIFDEILALALAVAVTILLAFGIVGIMVGVTLLATPY